MNNATMIDENGLHITQIVNHLVLSGIMCLLGMIANIINMIIFVKQGLDNTINISFFAMAISDFCSLITLEWLNICLNPFMARASLPFEPSEVQFLTGGFPHSVFIRITCWITVYITAERFICIAFPLKVKQIITPQRTRIAICLIYLIMSLTSTLEYTVMYFGKKFYPHRNETRVGLIVYEEAHKVLGDVSKIVHVAISFVSFASVVILTVALVIKLQRKTKWRKSKLSDKEQSEAISTRDRRTIKMVVLIATVVIICFVPVNMLNVAVFIIPEFNLMGAYANLFNITYSIAFLFEAVNASFNVVLYYNMSSKYRAEVHKLFSRCIILGDVKVGSLHSHESGGKSAYQDAGTRNRSEKSRGGDGTSIALPM